jgi:tetratricopeptide (TPR) repeat protein
MRILQSITLHLLWIMAAGAFAQSSNKPDSFPDSFDDLLFAARQAQSKEDYASAAGYYRRAVLLRGDIPELWANLGLMQDGIGSYSDAVASFQKAELLKPSLYVPNLFLGIDYLHLKRTRDAIPFLLKAETLNSSDPQAPMALGRAYLSLSNLAAARGAYQRAVALDPRNSSAWYGLGIAALKEVEVNGRKLSADGPNSAYSHALFAESLQEQGRFEQAKTEAQAVLTADPHFQCAHAQLGFIYLARRQNDDAAREFGVEAHSCALTDLGRARLRLDEGDNASALALLTDLWTRDAGFVRTNLLSLVDGLDAEHKNSFSDFVSRQDAAGAMSSDLSALLSAVLRGLPQPVKESIPAKSSEGRKTGTAPNLAAAETNARAGQYARCVGDLAHEADERGARPINANALLLLANCAYMTGDYTLSARAADLAAAQPAHEPAAALYWSIQANEKLAFTSFSRFEQLEPDSPKTHLLLGDIHRRRQHLEEAENEYKAAAALDPHDPAPLYGLASAYSQDAKPDQAMSAVKTALGMSPDDPDLNLLAGEILIEQHEWAQAENYLKQSLNAAHPLKPQILPHVHVLLGQVYAQTDRPQEAIGELQMGLASDEDGSVYYQLARVYTRLGNKAAAQTAIVHVKELERKKRERAVIAVQDSGAAVSDVP